MNVLSTGFINLDIIVHADRFPSAGQSAPINHRETSPGGSATNTALALASMDHTVHLAGRVGKDNYGERITAELDEYGVSLVTEKHDSPTRLLYGLVVDTPEPRYFPTTEHPGEQDQYNFGTGLWGTVDHLHVTSFNEQITSTLTEDAIKHGATVSFEATQGFRDNPCKTVIEQADIVFLNQDEERMFTTTHGSPDTYTDTIIVTTLGQDGARLYHQNKSFEHTGFDVDEGIVDTAGAGDAFTAGFLHQWSEDQELSDPVGLLEFANACGVEALTTVGAPTMIDTDAVLGRLNQ